MKNALILNRTAEKYGISLDVDLLALADAASKVTIPAPSYSDAVARAIAAVGSKDFEKVVKAETEALARFNVQFANDVKRGAGARVEAEYAARIGDVFNAFGPVLADRVKVLNDEAPRLPAHLNKTRVIDADIDTIIRFRAVESAWQDIETIASALKPYVPGRGDHGARFAPLLVTNIGTPPSLAHAVEMKDAMDGKWRGMSGPYTSVESDVDVLPPPALAALGATFSLATPDTFGGRVETLDHYLRPKTYREEYDDAALYEPNKAPKTLVL